MARFIVMALPWRWMVIAPHRGAWRAPSAPILALVTAPETTGEASRRPKTKPSRDVAQLASRLSLTLSPYLRKKPFFQAIANGAQSFTGTYPTVIFGFSKVFASTTGSTAKASSVSPFADLSPDIAQEESAIVAAVAPIPNRNSLRVKLFWFSIQFVNG